MHIVYIALAMTAFVSCKGVGFRQMEGASEKATIQSANETLQSIEVALERFHEINHRYPSSNDLTLFDSIKDFFLIPVDAAYLYRNENDQATYIAVGGRRNKIVYHYPATLGSGEYTLYWIGLNGIDEEGRGDDVFAIPPSSGKQLSHQIFVNFREDSAKVEFVISATGGDVKRDSVIFSVRSGKNILYADEWSLGAYVANRPELSDRERQEVLNAEFDRFLRVSHFNRADSLAKDPGSLLTRRIDSKDFTDLERANLPVFTYFSASEGAKAIYWNVRERKISVIGLSS
ncbi:MAG TPA: hypothetical protein VEW28_07310 [Candidatus Kapabacteria bacterium]|nr:hypothetical protein [Candidatus Kapabacteria bacterium]